MTVTQKASDTESYAHHPEPGLPQAAQSHGPDAQDDDDADAQPVFSRFIDDEIYFPLLVEFAADLPGNIGEIEQAVDGRRHAEAQRLSHKLKGAAATYGYPDLAKIAADAEDLLHAAEANATKVDEDHLGALAVAMRHMCRRICAGTKLRDPSAPLQ